MAEAKDKAASDKAAEEKAKAEEAERKALEEQPAAARAQATAEEAGKLGGEGDAQKYEVDRLILDAEAMTGHPQHVVAGALHGIKGPISKAEAKSLSDRWLKTEVQMEPTPETQA